MRGADGLFSDRCSKTDTEGHDAAIASLMHALEVGAADRPHLGDFLDRWRRTHRSIVAVPVKPPVTLVGDGEGGHLPSERVLP